jgi:hypothetical protein
VLAAALVDLFRSRRSLLTEIALLRHQLSMLERSGRPAAGDAARPDRAGGTRCHHADVEERAAGGPPRDASPLAPRRLQGSLALALAQPAWPTFRIAAETVALIRTMARENALWGAAWACDFLQAYDLFFRPIFTLAFIELATRNVVFAPTTRSTELRAQAMARAAQKFQRRERKATKSPSPRAKTSRVNAM